MTAALLFSRTAEASPWGEAARIVRRIALLRASGRGTEAEAVAERDLPAALEAARSSEVSAVAADRRLAALLSIEEKRMAQAASMAELLAPMLVERLRGAAPVTPGVQPCRATGFRAVPEPGKPARALPRPPDIADMIDGMLALESVERQRREAPAP